LRRRLLAGATSVIMGLGLAVGGLSPAMAAQPTASLPTITGVSFTQENGITCGKAGYQKPGAMDASSGSYTAPWGSTTWTENGVFAWNLAPGYDVDFCVKGSTIVAGIDSSAYNGTSFDFKTQTGHGTSHVGFRIVSTPEPTMIVDCAEISYETQRPLNGADHINVDVVYNGERGQINLEINENQSGNGDPASTSGFHAFLKFADSFGIDNVKVPISQEELDSGILRFDYGSYFDGSWTIEWVQFNSTYFNQTRDELKFVVCNDLPTYELVVPAASMQQLTCDSDGSYTLDTVEGVVWFVSIDDGPYVETEAGEYPVTEAQTVKVRAETVSDEYGFAPETDTTWTFGFLEPVDCPLPPECIPDEYISYTYSASTNSGVVTVEQPAGEEFTDQLCAPLYVTAAAWAFNSPTSLWTQTLVDAQEINNGVAITKVGTYEYGIPVDCGQGDIYASRTEFPRPSPLLNGPNRPAWPDDVTPWQFQERFLHNMGFDGPRPTYMYTNPGCNAETPIEPTVSYIVECGTSGSITLPDDNPYVSYTVRDASGTVVAVEDAREGEFTVTAHPSFSYVLQNYPEGGWSYDLGEYYECPIELEPEPVITLGNCFDSENSYALADIAGVQWLVGGNPVDPGTYVLEEGDYNSEGILTVEITAQIDESAEGGPYEFADGATRSWTEEFTEVTEADCVLPITDVTLAFNDPTCVDPQSLNVEGFTFDAELAELDGAPVVESDREYTVVFTAIGEKTVFFQSSEPVNGRQVSEDGKTLTLTGMLDGPNEELCELLEVVDPFEYVDTCLTASYTLFSAEGLRYTVTVNGEDPFEVTFGEGEASKTFTASPGDYVLATPVAEPGYVLSPDQPAPLDRTFATYPNGCQLPEFPNWPASATATDEVCTPFGVTSGSITVELSEGPSTNPTPVRYYIAHETAQEQELTSATTTVPSGSYIVTAVLTDPTDSLNDAGNEPVDFALTVGAADESDCDLPTLAITGASNAITGVGIGAVIIILAGMGFVLRRQLTA